MIKNARVSDQIAVNTYEERSFPKITQMQITDLFTMGKV